jgi:hypothetical protein
MVFHLSYAQHYLSPETLYVYPKCVSISVAKSQFAICYNISLVVNVALIGLAVVPLDAVAIS